MTFVITSLTSTIDMHAGSTSPEIVSTPCKTSINTDIIAEVIMVLDSLLKHLMLLIFPKIGIGTNNIMLPATPIKELLSEKAFNKYVKSKLYSIG